VQVAGLSNIRSLVTHGGSALALDADGHLWGWGSNGGKLGDGTTTDRPSPVAIDLPSEVTAMALGGHHGLALTRDGTVWAWGGNTVGQLGAGAASAEIQLTPVRVPGLTNVQAIAAGTNHSLALMDCGQLWVWGANHLFQLGDGTTADTLRPLPLAGFGDDDDCETVSLRIQLAGDAPFVSDAVAISVGEAIDREQHILALLPRGASVDLTARIELGDSDRRVAFERWAVDCQGSELQTTVVADRSKVCAASYMAQMFEGALLQIVNDGGGTITSSEAGILGSAAIHCGATCSAIFRLGTDVVLSATAGNGFAFASWEGDCSGSLPMITITMSGPRTCRARFRPSAPGMTLTVEVNAPSGSIFSVVAIEPVGSTILCRASGGPVCSESFAAGTTVILRPDDSSLELGRFTGWTGCDSVGALSACTVTLTANRSVTASFSQ
jgi:hypothetical protein